MRNRLIRGIVFLSLLVSQSFAASSRLAIPNPDQEAKLRQAVHAQFSEMYAGTTRNDQLNLSRLLVQESTNAETTDQQYALLCEARDTAARAGDFATAERICSTIVDRFDLSLATARVGTFAAAVGANLGGQTDQYFTLLVCAIDQALLADDFDPARRLLQMGASASANLTDGVWQKKIGIHQADFDLQLKAYSDIELAIDGLKQKPSDPICNLIVGKYECFVKGNWQTGLPMLSRGNDDNLRRLARMELSEPANVSLQIVDDGRLETTVADEWETLVQAMPEYQLQLNLHVYDWYLRALPRLPNPGSGEGNRVERQILTLLPRVQNHREYAALWFAISHSLCGQAGTPSKISGGSKAVEPFQNLPVTGGLLIGFHTGYALLNGHKVITYLQPIYDTPDGPQDGPAFGKQYSKLQIVRAPIGYAIGAIKVSGDAGLNSMTLTYMRIDQDHLNAKDTLGPVHLGGSGGTSQNCDGRGIPIIGICGRQKDGYLGLGVIYSQPLNLR